VTDSEVPDFGSPHVDAHVADHVLHLRINRPERRNAFTQDMYRAIKRAAIWSDRQADLDAVCITGTDGWFGAGGDLARRTSDGVTALDEEWDGTDHFPFRHIERSRKIWVARVNGVCHAGGVDLCLHCDVTIASDLARFRLPELLRGLPDPMMAGRLVAAIGLAKARNMIFTAAELTAAQAEAVGLVGTVVPNDELDTAVEWALQQIRLTGPSARALLKREINSHLPAHDMTMFSRMASEEMLEGMASFVEKRPPVWRAPTHGG
jgi:enoyl-CoA hydratase/carnithine racemase